LENSLNVGKGEKVNGRFRMKANEERHRNQDIEIEFGWRGERFQQKYFMK
jgi:hypothetical protein